MSKFATPPDLERHEKKMRQRIESGELESNQHMVEISDQEVNQSGAEDKMLARHRKGRQEKVRDLIYDQNHHHKFNTCVEKLKEVDEEDRYASVRIQKWAKAAELHLKAMGKYVPDVKAVQLDVTQETQAAAQGISRAAEIIANLAGSRLPGNDEKPVQGGSVVSTQVRDEEEGHGGSGQQP